MGPHEVVGVLGRSTANEVLLATTRGPRGFVRPVVLKCVRDPQADPGATHALAREALAYARINHPNVVQLFEVVEQEGHVTLVLEYVPGASLARVRALLNRRGVRLGDACVLHVMAGVFAGLAAAHEARDAWTGEFVPVVHRDVNPNNVLLSWEGAVKLTDFGIARVTGVTSDTYAGQLKGTYAFMAPEQVLGEAITPRTDVYCACLLLRELLLGRRNFDPRGKHELEFMQEMAAPKLEPIERLRPGVPPVIAGALRVGLEVDPDARSVTAADLRDVLSAFVRADEARRELAATLASIRAEREVAPLEQSVTTGRTPLVGLPARVATRAEAPTPKAAPVAPAPPTSPAAVSVTMPRASLPSITVQTPHPMMHSIVPVDVVAPRRRQRDASVFLAASIACTLAAAFWLVHRVAPPRSRPAAASTAPVSSSAAAIVVKPAGAPPAPAPSHPAPPRLPAPVASASPSTAPSASPSGGTLRTPELPISHRVYVDGRVAGATGQPLRVPCGPHYVRLGTAGRLQWIDVPCGGEVVVRPQW